MVWDLVGVLAFGNLGASFLVDRLFQADAIKLAIHHLFEIESEHLPSTMTLRGDEAIDRMFKFKLSQARDELVFEATDDYRTQVRTLLRQHLNYKIRSLTLTGLTPQGKYFSGACQSSASRKSWPSDRMR